MRYDIMALSSALVNIHSHLCFQQVLAVAKLGNDVEYLKSSVDDKNRYLSKRDQ